MASFTASIGEVGGSIMSDNIPLRTQHSCTENEYYRINVFSNAQLNTMGSTRPLEQLIVFITRASENSERLDMLQVRTWGLYYYWRTPISYDKRGLLERWCERAGVGKGSRMETIRGGAGRCLRGEISFFYVSGANFWTPEIKTGDAVPLPSLLPSITHQPLHSPTE